MINGSRGPLLRKATALDWVGDPFDASGFVALHGESTYAQFLDHYREYTDVVGDHFLTLVATTLPTNAYLATGEARYRRWVVDYMDPWLGRMQANGGIIPSFVDLDGRIDGPEGRWWNNAYGWGFSPVNPATGKREDRNRIPRALVGFSNALLVTGDHKYIDAWPTMIDAVNANARVSNGRTEFPTMRGADGWYGWRSEPWRVGALVNVNPAAARTVVVQAGAYGEHQVESVDVNGRTVPVGGRDFTVHIAPGAGATLTLTMRRYANTPTVSFPWDR